MRRLKKNKRHVQSPLDVGSEAIPSFIDPDFDDMEGELETLREEYRGYGDDND